MSEAHAQVAGDAGTDAGTEGGQQHPLGIYLKIWILLFVLSSLSYAVDYFQFQGYMRWTLIIIFMLLKAGFIIAIFMHMMWERMALITAILLPPLCLLVLIAIMSIEGDFTYAMRDIWMGQDTTQLPKSPVHH
jgi:cytochrome c oxidase subunit 4